MDRNQAHLVPRWNMWQAVLLLLVFYYLQWVLGWLDGVDDLTNPKAFLSYIFTVCCQFVLGMALLLLFVRVLRRPLSDLGLGKFRLHYIVIGVPTGLILTVGVALFSNLLAFFWADPAPQAMAQALAGAEAGWQATLLIFSSTCLTPFLEELLFRGLLYPPLRFQIGPLQAALLVSLLFAGLHGDLFRLVPLCLGALGLTFLFEKTGSLWPGIVAHGTWNLLMVTATLLTKVH